MASSEMRAENRFTTIRDLKWSQAEKTVARRAFEKALRRELVAVIAVPPVSAAQHHVVA